MAGQLPERAMPSRQTAVAIGPWLVEAFALHRAGRLAEAERLYQQILAAHPDHCESLYLLGVISYQRGDHAQALGRLDLALEKQPDNGLVHNQRGLVLKALRRFDEALASYDRALAVSPEHAEAHCNRGAVLYELRRPDEAVASCDRALALNPHYAEAFANRGFALQELRRFEEALASYDRALELGLNRTELSYNRGSVLLALKRFADALASFDHVLTLWPDRAELHCNRGVALGELDRFEEAVASFDRALVLKPDLAEAHSNRGTALHEMKRFEEALTSYARALALRPDFAHAHYSEAHSRILMGDLPRGWEKHEWRWKIDLFEHTRRNFAQPLWLGDETIAGKTVLLHADHGFGDAMQFCRYAPLVAARGARVILEVQEPLRELMETLAGVTQVVARGEPLPDFDLHCPLLSLPLAFRTAVATIPAATPYLSAAPAAAARWQARLGPRRRPRIGLAWCGNPNHGNDRKRSIELNAMLPLLDGIDATFVSLQRDVRAGDPALLQERRDLLHFGEELKDFADTAALMANLDLVIAVDTAVVHLAGALAKPVWIMLSYVPEWRWLLDREGCPWYPTARLFRQDEARAWDRVIARVHAALRGEFAAREFQETR